MTAIGVILMAVGATLSLIGGIGVARFPTTLARTQAASKPASLGMVMVVLGAGVAARSWALAGVAVVMGVFQFVTAPVAGHLVGRVASGSSLLESDDSLPARPVTGRWLLVVQVTVLWGVLWRDASLGVLVAGFAIGFLMAVLVGASRSGSRPGLRAVPTLGAYLVSLIRSNFRTAVQVIRMRPDDVHETIVHCHLETRSEDAAVFAANAISFSPGTLTLEMSPSAPYRIAVHALGQTDEEARAEVARLEKAAERMYANTREQHTL